MANRPSAPNMKYSRSPKGSELRLPFAKNLKHKHSPSRRIEQPEHREMFQKVKVQKRKED